MGSYADGHMDGEKGIEKVRKQRDEANERILKLEKENADMLKALKYLCNMVKAYRDNFGLKSEGNDKTDATDVWKALNIADEAISKAKAAR